ncbi:MAG: alanine racemase [Ruminiclostridium sp.]|nr:alanine racemase [Ruminiclostridium sp.]
MKKFLKRAWAEIDLDALEHNFNEIKKLSKGKEILAVVKANAYGHDDKAVCLKLQELGVKYFGVSNLWEGEKLRQHGIKGTILSFGYTDEDYFDELLEYGITQTAGSVQYAKELSDYALSKGVKLPVHIKINTGMTRVGIDSEEELLSVLALPGLDCKAAYTHFAVSDSLDKDDVQYTKKQQEKLLSIAKGKGLLLHSQNSGGIVYHPDFEGDIVRAGVIMYGHSPNYPLEVPFEMKSVMTVKSIVSQLKTIPAGTQISYGRTFTADKEMTVAVIPIGYADGYFRDFSSKGQMLINGVLCPVVGRVCMDQTIVDVSAVTDIKTGDTVYVYSDKCEQTGIDYNASLIGTIGYELTCAVALRIPRVIIHKGEIKEVVRYGLI